MNDKARARRECVSDGYVSAISSAHDARVTDLAPRLSIEWSAVENNATTYRLEVEDLQGHPIISAILPNQAKPTTSDATLPTNTLNYRAPSWLKDKLGNTVARWRVIAFDQQNNPLSQSDWRTLRLAKAAT